MSSKFEPDERASQVFAWSVGDMELPEEQWLEDDEDKTLTQVRFESSAIPTQRQLLILSKLSGHIGSEQGLGLEELLSDSELLGFNTVEDNRETSLKTVRLDIGVINRTLGEKYIELQGNAEQARAWINPEITLEQLRFDALEGAILQMAAGTLAGNTEELRSKLSGISAYGATQGIDFRPVYRVDQQTIEIYRAIHHRQQITFRYSGKDRVLNPLQLAYLEGSFYVQGQEVSAEDKPVKLFKLRRIEASSLQVLELDQAFEAPEVLPAVSLQVPLESIEFALSPQISAEVLQLDIASSAQEVPGVELGGELSGWKRYEVNHRDRFEWFYAAKRFLGDMVILHPADLRQEVLAAAHGAASLRGETDAGLEKAVRLGKEKSPQSRTAHRDSTPRQFLKANAVAMFVANYVRAKASNPQDFVRLELSNIQSHFPFIEAEKVVDYLGRIRLSLIDSEVETPPLEIEYHNGASYVSVRLNPLGEKAWYLSIPLSPDEAMQLLLGLEVLQTYLPSQVDLLRDLKLRLFSLVSRGGNHSLPPVWTQRVSMRTEALAQSLREVIAKQKVIELDYVKSPEPRLVAPQAIHSAGTVLYLSAYRVDTKPYAWHEYRLDRIEGFRLTSQDVPAQSQVPAQRADTAREVELGFDPSDMRVRTLLDRIRTARIIDPVVGADVEMWRARLAVYTGQQDWLIRQLLQFSPSLVLFLSGPTLFPALDKVHQVATKALRQYGELE